MANNNHFGLTLDTLAPSGSISANRRYANQNFNLTIVKGDATYMKLWFNGNATGTKEDTGYAQATWEPADISYTTDFTTDGIYYYHMVLMDDVNNESPVYNTTIITFDTVPPVIDAANTSINNGAIITEKSGVTYTVTFSDSGTTSGIASLYMTCTHVDPDTGETISDINPITINNPISPYTGTFDFVPGVSDGNKTFTITVTDNAGNVSSPVVKTALLDTEVGVPTITLKNAAGTETLPPYINYKNIKVYFDCDQTDISYYKFWQGSAEDEPSSWTANPDFGQELHLVYDITLDDTNGLKQFNAKVKDRGGLEATAIPGTVTLDTTIPTVNISSNKNAISDQSGYNTAVLTLVGTDSLSGVKDWDLLCGSTSIKGSLTTIPATFNLTSANAMVEGLNTIKLTVTDNAENTNYAECYVTLDTQSPTASINNLNTWYNDEFGITVNFSDGSGVGVEKIYAWTNTTPNDETAGTIYKTVTSSPASISADTIEWHLSQTNANYMHIKVVDKVGNYVFAHAQFGYDDVPPSQPQVIFTQSHYNTTSAEVKIIYSIDTSGVAYMRIEGNITNPTLENEWEAISSSRQVTLTTGDGTKSVTVQVKDNAGNISVLSVPATTVLDQTTPSPQLSIYEADGITIKPANSPFETLAAHIGCTENDLNGIRYQIYGDFTFGSQAAQGIVYNDGPVSVYAINTAYTLGEKDVFVIHEEESSGDTIYVLYKLNANITAEENINWNAVSSKFTVDNSVWKEFNLDSGKTYETVLNMYCTSGDGIKHVYLRILDAAANISGAADSYFNYDTEPPVVVITDPDYNRVSKVHSLRRSSEGTIADKYADEVHFTFVPDSNIQAYKICAYRTEAQAKWQDWEEEEPSIPRNPAVETPIKQTGDTGSHGSINMHATGLSSDDRVSCMLKGADYEDALVARGAIAGDTAEGAHIVVVYVQDLAGQWSAVWTTSVVINN